MYIPTAFNETNLNTLHGLMQQYSFATLITSQNGVPFASHLPFVLEEGRGEYGALLSHVARANPQWKSFEEGVEALVIFQGSHAYLSPSWYETRQSVPTWNYAVVHAYGVPRIIQEDERVYRLLQSLVHTHEAAFEEPWTMDRLTEEYVKKMMSAIVGFEIEINRLEGKFKLSQNRPAEDLDRVISALEQSASELDREIAKLMRERNG